VPEAEAAEMWSDVGKTAGGSTRWMTPNVSVKYPHFERKISKWR
jgi:hypothetical protein